VALKLAPATLYGVLAVLGFNIGMSDLVDTASVGNMLGYGQAGAAESLALSAVRLSGGTHFPVAASLAALGLSARARRSKSSSGNASAHAASASLPDHAARTLSLGLALAVCPLAFTVSAWVRMVPPGAGLPPIVLFILARLALEASAGLAALVRPPGALPAALRDASDAAWALKPASVAGVLLWAVAAGCASSAALALVAPAAYVAMTWPGADAAALPALARDLLPALAGAMLAATAAALTLAGGVRTAAAERAQQPMPYLVLCAGLAAMGATHAGVHAAAKALPGAAAGVLCFVAAAAAARELMRVLLRAS